jgi:putative restriction endonuclease
MIANNSDTLMRAAAFDHVRRLCEVHDHLTAFELRKMDEAANQSA